MAMNTKCDAAFQKERRREDRCCVWTFHHSQVKLVRPFTRVNLTTCRISNLCSLFACSVPPNTNAIQAVPSKSKAIYNQASSVPNSATKPVDPLHAACHAWGKGLLETFLIYSMQAAITVQRPSLLCTCTSATLIS